MTDLTPADLDAIEARQARCYTFNRPGDVMVSPEEDAYALLSALRAAWEERDRFAKLVEKAYIEGWFAAKRVRDIEFPDGYWLKSDARRALTPPGETERPAGRGGERMRESTVPPDDPFGPHPRVDQTLEDLLDTFLKEGKLTGDYQRHLAARWAIQDYVATLQEQLTECAGDALRWRIVSRHATWVRRKVDSNTGEVGTFLEVRVVNNADLSCRAMRDAAVDALDEEPI